MFGDHLFEISGFTPQVSDVALVGLPNNITSQTLLAVIGENSSNVVGSGIVLLLIGKGLVFFVVIIPVGILAFLPLGKYLKNLHFPEVEFSMLLIGALAYAVAFRILTRQREHSRYVTLTGTSLCAILLRATSLESRLQPFGFDISNANGFSVARRWRPNSKLL